MCRNMEPVKCKLQEVMAHRTIRICDIKPSNANGTSSFVCIPKCFSKQGRVRELMGRIYKLGRKYHYIQEQIYYAFVDTV